MDQLNFFFPIHASKSIIFILRDSFDPVPGGKVVIKILVKIIEVLIPIIILKEVQEIFAYISWMTSFENEERLIEGCSGVL